MNRYDRIATELKAMAHPLRLRILSCVAEDLQEPMVVWRHLLESEPQLQIALVSYHIAKLREAGLIRLLRTEPAGNFKRHFYVLSPRGRHLAEALEL